MTSLFQSPALLRYALIGDAIASGATGLMMAAGAGVLGDPLGLPEPLLRYAGVFLLAYAAAVAYVGTRARIARGAVWTIIVLNALWAIESVALALTNLVAPTALGAVFVVGQAVVVLGFAAAQYAGLPQAAARGTLSAA